jgi:hypothetical protein
MISKKLVKQNQLVLRYESTCWFYPISQTNNYPFSLPTERIGPSSKSITSIQNNFP